MCRHLEAPSSIRANLGSRSDVKWLTALHVCDGLRRPVIMLLSEGHMKDHKGAASMINSLPKAKEELGDIGYPTRYDRILPRAASQPAFCPDQIAIRRSRFLSPAHKFENMFRRLKDWRRIQHPLRRMRPHLHVRHLRYGNCRLLNLINDRSLGSLRVYLV
jgi:hypothetical protein